MRHPTIIKSLSRSIAQTTLVGGALCFASMAKAQVSDPVPEVPADSGIVLELEEFVTIPSSNNSSPRARINHLKPLYDGQGRLAVNDLRGKLWVIADSVVTEYADLDDLFPAFRDSPGLGSGFTSFSFHPDFANNGKFYTAHSEAPGTAPADFPSPLTNAPVSLQGVITEWTASDPAAATFAGDRREILRVDLTHTIHGMQEISFNPNAESGEADYGLLYICIGDAGATIQGYPGNTSRLDSVLGSILRIDPAGTDSANGEYGIPADNPWATDGNADTFGEIWAYGFRNPHRISWDAAGDGKMLSGDIGERNIEEVNLIEAGGHYGWNQREGTFVINPDFENNPSAGEREEVFELPGNDASFGFTYPVAQYDHNQGAAIVSGYVYRGSSAPLIAGKFIFGDILDGRVYFADADTMEQGTQSTIFELSLQLDGEITTISDIGGSSRADLRFGYDESNELYLLEKSRGMVFKVVGASDGISTPNVAGKFVNISTRGRVGLNDRVLIGGFVIGEDNQRVLVQAIGPELGLSGVTGFMEDPILEIFNSSDESIALNDDWEDDPTQAPLINDLWGGVPPMAVGSKSSAVLIDLAPGSYTAIVSGSGDTEGVALVEVYQIDR